MKNLFISNLHETDVEHCTSDFGLKVRKKIDKPFKKLCNIFTNANIIRMPNTTLSDEDYFETLPSTYIPLESYDTKEGKNNIIVERYPELPQDEPYIFVCNHTCPEDIETVLNIIDRNAYLILGSIESLQYDREMYLSFINGMIPFDILVPEQRKIVFDKMKRVLKTNSILIFPEGSHNYSPNNLINPLFDGPVNLSLQTGRKIVVVTLLRDQEHNASYIDVSNPIDVTKLEVNMEKEFQSETEREKYYVKALSSKLRDKMATAVYHLMERHFPPLDRTNIPNLEEYLRQQKIKDSFKKLKWNKDIFEAEFLVKKSASEKEHEEVVRTIYNLTLNPNAFVGGNRYWVLEKENMDNINVPNRMRQYLHKIQSEDGKKLSKKK